MGLEQPERSVDKFLAQSRHANWKQARNGDYWRRLLGNVLERDTRKRQPDHYALECISAAGKLRPARPDTQQCTSWRHRSNREVDSSGSEPQDGRCPSRFVLRIPFTPPDGAVTTVLDLRLKQAQADVNGCRDSACRGIARSNWRSVCNSTSLPKNFR